MDLLSTSVRPESMSVVPIIRKRPIHDPRFVQIRKQSMHNWRLIGASLGCASADRPLRGSVSGLTSDRGARRPAS